MKRKLGAIGIAAAVAVLSSAAAPAFAQGMMWGYGAAPATGTQAAQTAQTAQEEAEGKAILERLQAKQAACADLKDDDFDKLGDYYMGLMMGPSHAAMNQALAARLGDSGETQMHVAMGKRMSGCDASATYPAQGYGSWPMMGPWMMGGYGGYPGAASVGDAIASWVTTGLVWLLLGLGVIALIKSLTKKK